MLNKVKVFYALSRHTFSLSRCFGPRWVAYRLGYALQQRSGLIERRMPRTTWVAQPLRVFLNDLELVHPEHYLAYRRQNGPSFFFDSTQFPIEHREASIDIQKKIWDRSNDFSRSGPAETTEVVTTVQKDYLNIYSAYFPRWDKGKRSPFDLAAELVKGQLLYFEHTPAQIGFPPDWHKNPFTGQESPTAQHWSRIGDFSLGDIKIIWEPSRFGFVYALVRAYARTGDEQYAECFWQLVEDWRKHNPPQHGVNWKCGQETSFRVMAWCFGLYAFLNSSATTAIRMTHLAQMIAISGERIAANIKYALSQRNNHGISEGLGLWTIGTLFPEFLHAKKWQQVGRKVLESEGRELIYEDGAFSQHSVNYHRLMLHDYLWCLRLGDIVEQPFSDKLRQRVAKAGDFLYQLQVGEQGEVPYYGQNDGALILPLNNCDYQDFRPVIQAIHYLSTGTRCYEDGPWDEDLWWLFGEKTLQSSVVAPPKQVDLRAEEGGYYILRSETSCAFIRCATFRDRPAQADMLHLDLWWRGQNIALDAGSYSYNASDPWNNPLSHTKYHNTVTVDDMDQMARVRKFLWLPWLKSQVQSQLDSPGGHIAYWQGEHNGYERLPSPLRYQRAIVRLGSDTWLVLDKLISDAQHSYRLHWLFADFPYLWDQINGKLTLHTSEGDYHAQLGLLDGQALYSLVRADEESPRGWRAPYYSHREPALSVDARVEGTTLYLWTIFGRAPYQFRAKEDKINIEAQEWQAELNLVLDSNDLMVSSITINGQLLDSLTIYT